MSVISRSRATFLPSLAICRSPNGRPSTHMFLRAPQPSPVKLLLYPNSKKMRGEAHVWTPMSRTFLMDLLSMMFHTSEPLSET